MWKIEQQVNTRSYLTADAKNIILSKVTAGRAWTTGREGVTFAFGIEKILGCPNCTGEWTILGKGKKNMLLSSFTSHLYSIF